MMTIEVFTKKPVSREVRSAAIAAALDYLRERDTDPAWAYNEYCAQMDRDRYSPWLNGATAWKNAEEVAENVIRSALNEPKVHREALDVQYVAMAMTRTR